LIETNSFRFGPVGFWRWQRDTNTLLPRGFARVASRAALDATARTGSAPLRAALTATAPGTPRLSGPLIAVDPARDLVVTLLTTPADGAGVDLDGADLTGQANAIRDQLQNALGARVTMTTIQVDGEPALRGQAGVRADGLPVRLATMDACRLEVGRRAAQIIAGRNADPAIEPEVVELFPTLQPGDTIRHF